MTVWTGPPPVYNGTGIPAIDNGRFAGRPVMFSGSGYLPPDPRQTMPPVSGGPVQMMPDGRTGFSDMMGRVQRPASGGPTASSYGGAAPDMSAQIAEAARDPMVAERLRMLVSSIQPRQADGNPQFTMPPQHVSQSPSISPAQPVSGPGVHSRPTALGGRPPSPSGPVQAEGGAPDDRMAEYRQAMESWRNRRQNDRKERFNSDPSAESIEKKQLVDQSPSQPGNVSSWRDRVQQMRGKMNGRGWGRGGRVGVGQGLARGNPNPKSWSERLAMR